MLLSRVLCAQNKTNQVRTLKQHSNCIVVSDELLYTLPHVLDEASFTSLLFTTTAHGSLNIERSEKTLTLSSDRQLRIHSKLSTLPI